MTDPAHSGLPQRKTAADRPAALLSRHGTPALQEWSLDPAVRHLNHGSFGAVPTLALRAQQLFRDQMESNPCEWFMAAAGRVAPARTATADFLGTNPEHTALVPNASGGASVVYNSVPTWPGLEIITTDHTYGAVRMGAERLARRHDGSLREIHVPLAATADEVVDSVVAAFNERTALIVIDQITSATARAFPVDRIAAHARLAGIPILVDAAHAPGMVADPSAGIDADFWVGNLHKFACAPRGTAALVTNGSHDQSLFPLIDSWGAPERFPDRFDQQGTIDFTSYLAAPVAFAAVEDLFGWETIRTYTTELADYGERIIAAAFSELTGEDHRVNVGMPTPALRLIRLPGGLATTHEGSHELRHWIATTTGFETAITTWRGKGYLRISAAAYNSASDYEDFTEAVVPAIVALAH